MNSGGGEKYAFLICGTHSGCGKTTVTLGLLAALKGRGYDVQPFKVGPDFIDPGLHTQIASAQSRNLDGWMLSRKWNVELFRRLLDRSDIGLIEGVMGLFDGYDGETESGSSAEMAKWLGIPAVLIVDARSMARSAAALVYGFTRFDPALNIAGVIFNRVGGEAHLKLLRDAIASSCPEVIVLGGIPREDRVQMPERHLGLVTSDEMKLDADWQRTLTDLLEKSLDIDLLLQKSLYAAPVPGKRSLQPYAGAPVFVPEMEIDPVEQRPAETISSNRDKPVIGIARDAAFCFYYPENLELLEQAGSILHFFSPVDGETLPESCAGVYLGGGYPELFAREISGNTGFLASLRERAMQGMPIYAECGGLMTLGRFINTVEGERYQMAGIMPFGTRMLPRRKALGYTQVVLLQQCLVGGPGKVIRGHEFHYSEIIEFEPNSSVEFVYELQRRKSEAVRREGFQTGSVLASYVHLHWGSAPEAASEFVRHCTEWMKRRRQL